MVKVTFIVLTTSAQLIASTAAAYAGGDCSPEVRAPFTDLVKEWDKAYNVIFATTKECYKPLAGMKGSHTKQCAKLCQAYSHKISVIRRIASYVRQHKCFAPGVAETWAGRIGEDRKSAKDEGC